MRSPFCAYTRFIQFDVFNGVHHIIEVDINWDDTIAVVLIVRQRKKSKVGELHVFLAYKDEKEVCA
jgi:hypothetical protein